ncbi:hypothetical protein SAMN04488000_105121 [Lentzea albida]|uniref:Uncharacterized protein n=2 Tax=Lentzea albida TaxID=65499 RepID=A0A1H9K0Y0_9PSEU|nr:hypothetical protein SAMN04488000_105121 [Lentzea albida]
MLCMTGTPIFDELYAKYVLATPPAAPRPETSVVVPREPRYDQVVPQFAGLVDTPVWPS